MTDLRDLLSRATPDNDLSCADCGGHGEQFVHNPDCEHDSCALNGDIDSCNGMVVECHCRTSLADAAVNALPNLLSELDGARELAASNMHALSEAQAEIAMLRDIVVTYGDRLRMGTVHRMDWQQAIDRAFERDPA